MEPTKAKEQVPQIEASQNGPYLVQNLENLKNSKGEKLPTRPMVALCRCGGSANKPFCDGTHAKIGFSGEKLAERAKDKRDNYVGKKITIHDNRGICAHQGLCTDGLPAVFRMKTEPWIDPDVRAGWRWRRSATCTRRAVPARTLRGFRCRRASTR